MSPLRPVTAVLLLIAAGWLVAPAASSACAVCYGTEDSQMTQGLNNGILALLGVIASVQVGFVALFVSFRQRAKRLDASGMGLTRSGEGSAELAPPSRGGR